VPDDSIRVGKAGPDVIRLEPGVLGQEGLAVVASREHREHMFDRQAPPPDDRFAAEDRRIDRDAFQQLVQLIRRSVHEDIVVDRTLRRRDERVELAMARTKPRRVTERLLAARILLGACPRQTRGSGLPAAPRIGSRGANRSLIVLLLEVAPRAIRVRGATSRSARSNTTDKLGSLASIVSRAGALPLRATCRRTRSSKRAATVRVTPNRKACRSPRSRLARVSAPSARTSAGARASACRVAAIPGPSPRLATAGSAGQQATLTPCADPPDSVERSPFLFGNRIPRRP